MQEDFFKWIAEWTEVRGNADREKRKEVSDDYPIKQKQWESPIDGHHVFCLKDYGERG
jgi:hypothetical protein